MRKTKRTKRSVDAAAYEQAIRKWALPPCLHVPIVARDPAAIEDRAPHRAEAGDVVSVGVSVSVEESNA